SASSRSLDSLGEKVSQLINSLGGMRVFVGNRSTDRRRVNANFLGNILNHHWPQIVNSLIQKLHLTTYDGFTNPNDGLFALFNILNKLYRRRISFFHIIPDVF